MKKIIWRTWLIVSIALLLVNVLVWPLSYAQRLSIGRRASLKDDRQTQTSWLIHAKDGLFLWTDDRSHLIPRNPAWVPMPAGGMGYLPPHDDLPDPKPVDESQPAAPTSEWFSLEEKPNITYSFIGVPDDMTVFNGFIWKESFHHSGFDDKFNLNVYLTRTHVIMAPLWFLTVLFAMAPLIVLARWYGRRRLRGHDGQALPCDKCGYDLRGSPEVGKCPECGAKRA